jgi:hypothetical protein
MTTSRNKESARRLLAEGITACSDRVIDELVLPDYVDHNVIPGLPKPIPNREVFKKVLAAFQVSFPAFSLLPDGEMIAEGDRVATRFTFRGKNAGEFMGRPATNRDVTMTGIAYYRFAEDGRVAEAWVQEDVLGMLTQLGQIVS